jgi:hypothetical protein
MIMNIMNYAIKKLKEEELPIVERWTIAFKKSQQTCVTIA